MNILNVYKNEEKVCNHFNEDEKNAQDIEIFRTGRRCKTGEKILHKMIDIIALLFFANPAKAGRGKDHRNHSDSRTV